MDVMDRRVRLALSAAEYGVDVRLCESLHVQATLCGKANARRAEELEREILAQMRDNSARR